MIDTPRQARLRARRVAAALLGSLLLGGGGAYWLKQSWDATLRREALLPDLEAQAHTDPTNGPLLSLLAGRHAEAGDFETAAKLLERAVAAGETDTDVWLTWSAALAVTGNRQRAGAVLQTALKLPAAHDGAQSAIDRCKPLPAGVAPIELARAISPEGPTAFVARRTQGSFLNAIATRQGRSNPPKSGFATRQEWAKEAPDDPQVQTLWADALLKNGRFTEAGVLAEKVLEKHPDRSDTRLVHAEVTRQAGVTAKSGLEYIAILKKEPGNLEALLGMGRIALEKSLFPIAHEVFEKATKQAPTNPDGWIGLGRSHYSERINFGAAVEAFTQAQKIAPQRTDFYLSFANAQRAIFHWSEAETLIRKRLEDIPDDAEAHFQLAAVLLDSNRTPEREIQAEKELRRSLELEPGALSAMARLGSFLVVKKNHKEAIPLLEAVIASDIHHVTATKDLAQAYRLAGRQQEAKAAFESFTQLTDYIDKRNFLDDKLRRQPMSADFHDQLATLLEQGDEKDKAKLHRDAALILRKNPAMGKRGLEALTRARASAEIVEGATKK